MELIYRYNYWKTKPEIHTLLLTIQYNKTTSTVRYTTLHTLLSPVKLWFSQAQVWSWVSDHEHQSKTARKYDLPGLISWWFSDGLFRFIKMASNIIVSRFVRHFFKTLKLSIVMRIVLQCLQESIWSDIAVPPRRRSFTRSPSDLLVYPMYLTSESLGHVKW